MRSGVFLEMYNEPQFSIFSDLALFFFGSGMALFIALLGWSEQIRNRSYETRTLEEKFLQKHKLNKEEFALIIRPEDHEKRIEALMNLMTSGDFKTASQVELLGLFDNWNRELTKLESFYNCKYMLTITLTVIMFLCGVGSVFLGRGAMLFSVSAELLLLLLPLLFITIIVIYMVRINKQEIIFRNLLVKIDDQV